MRLASFNVGPGQLQHVGGLHVGERAEHRQQLGQVHKFRKPRMHPVARAVRCQFEHRHWLAEVRGPGIEMLDAGGFKHLRCEVALQRVHLGHGVGYRSAGGKHHAAPAVALAQISGLDKHIERAIALGVGQAGDAVHLGDEAQILVKV